MFLETISKDIEIIAEAIFSLYSILSYLLILVIYYFIYIGHSISIKKKNSVKNTNYFISGLPVIFSIILFLSYLFLLNKLLLPAILFFTIGIFCISYYYFKFFRILIKPDDFRIQYVAIIWAALSVITIISLFFLFLFKDTLKMEREFRISYDIIIQSGSVFISALGIVFTYLMRSEQIQRTSQQQLYQTLELQSVSLFQFECNNPNLTGALWFGQFDKDLSDAKLLVFNYSLRQYVCQILNLFEMSVRFRTQGILPSEVFGSWVIWMWELCQSEGFQKLWTDENNLPLNYVRDLREIINMGIEIELSTKDKNKKQDIFFKEVAEYLNCPEIQKWSLTDKKPFLKV